MPLYRAGLAASHNDLGVLFKDGGDSAGAEKACRAALALWDKLAADAPAVPWYRAGLADARHNLGDLLWRAGDRAGAAKEYRAALALREQLAADAPAVPDYQIALGNSYCHFGLMLHQGGHPADSLAWFDRAVRTLAPVYDRDRKMVTSQQSLRASHQGRATACDRLGKHADARADWDRAVDLCPTAEKVRMRAGRAASRVRAGHLAEGVAEVAELAQSAGRTAGEWYALAGVYAVASGQDAARRNEYAARAVELLGKAVKAGFTDAARLDDDPDYAPLCGRADYRELLAGLEAKHPRRSEAAPPPRPVR